MSKKYEWVIKSTITNEAKKLATEVGVPNVVAQILINRGFNSSEQIKEFLSPTLSKLPSPFLLSDIKLAAERIADAVYNKEKICIYGDYDIDGSTSVAVLATFLKELNASFFPYQPKRFGEGYGMSVEAVKKIIKDEGAQLIVSVDCGTSSIEAAAYCKKEKVDLVITDHHKLGDLIPEAYAFVNPHKPNEPQAFNCLAGVGVAYYLTIALRNVLRERKYFNSNVQEPNLKDYLDLVAFGTIADVVPILGINRIFVKRGLKLINENPRKGIKALAEVSSLKGNINCESIGYILAPRLNAAGRMGSASRSVDLLLSTDDLESQNLAIELNEENQKRVSYQNKCWQQVQAIAEQAVAVGSKYSLTFSGSGDEWHQGVIGIIASKAVEKWSLPTAIYSIGDNGIAKGSARSISGVDIFSIFSEFRDLFEDFGGHNMAAGMSIKTEKLSKFEELFEAGVSNYVKNKKIYPTIEVDVEIKSSDINLKTMKKILEMEPFGSENPSPVFLCRDVEVTNKTLLKDKHLKLKLDNEIDAIGFNMANRDDDAEGKIDVVFKPSINEWNGRKQIQYVLLDIG